jgi:hypothetical protein
VKLVERMPWSWLRECLDSFAHTWQRVAILKNLKYKIYFDLFNIFMVTTWFHMCSFIVLMSSLLFYNIVKIKKPLNEYWYCISWTLDFVPEK